jgi:hypothetical protein
MVRAHELVIVIAKALAEPTCFRMLQAIAAEENTVAHLRSASESPMPPARST